MPATKRISSNPTRTPLLSPSPPSSELVLTTPRNRRALQFYCTFVRTTVFVSMLHDDICQVWSGLAAWEHAAPHIITPLVLILPPVDASICRTRPPAHRASKTTLNHTPLKIWTLVWLRRRWTTQRSGVPNFIREGARPQSHTHIQATCPEQFFDPAPLQSTPYRRFNLMKACSLIP